MAREFSVIVGIDAGRARRGAREFKAGADQVVRSSKRMERGLAGANRRAVAVITTLGRLRGVATLAFSGFLGVGGITSVIRTLTQFGTAISAVTALVSAQSNDPRTLGGAMTALTERAREMGATTLFTATQAAEGMKFLTLAGFSAVEVMQAIEPALNLAAAGMLGLGEAADIVSNIMAAFNVSASRTEEVADALAFTAARTNTDIRQLGEAMKFVGPVAGTLGVDVQQTSVALGILGNSGLQASLAGTSLRRVMSGLLNPSKEADKVLSGMGLTSGELVDILQGGGKTGLGLVDLVNTLADAGIGAAEAFTLFGQRGAPGLLSLVTQREKLQGLTEELEDISGTVERMAKILADNLGGDARIALSALQESILALGDSGLTDFLRGAVQGFTGFIRTLAGIPIAVDEMTDSMQSGVSTGEFLLKHLRKIELVAKGLAVVLTTKLLVALTRSFAAMGAQAVANIFKFVASMTAGTAATTALTFALNLLKAALVTTGVGAILVGAGYLLEWATRSREASEETQTFSERIEALGNKAEAARVKFDAFNGARREAAFRDANSALVEAANAVDQAKKNLDAYRLANEQVTAQEEAANASRERAIQMTQALASSAMGYGSVIAINNPFLQEAADKQQQLEETNKTLKQSEVDLRAELEASVEEWAKQAEAMRLMVLVNQGFAESTDEAAKKLEAMREQQEKVDEMTQRLTGHSVAELEAFEKLIDKYDSFGKSIKELEAELEDLITLSNANAAAQAAAGTNTFRNARAIEELEFRIKKLKLELSGAEKAAVDFGWKLEELRAGSDKLKQADIEYRQSIVETVRQWQLSGRSVDELREALRLLKEQHEENIKKLEETCEKNKEVRECTEDSTKRIEEAWNNAVRGIQDTWQEFFRGGLKGFEDFADRIVDVFKDMISEMLAAWVTSGLMNIFQGKAFGASGNSFPFADLIGNVFGGGGGAGGGGSGGLGNIGSSLTGLWDGAKAFFSEAAFFLGEFAGGFSGFFTGVGGGTSATTFAGAGNWAAAGGSALAGAGVGAIAGLGVDALVGSRGDPTATVVLSAVGGIIGSIIPGLGTVLGAAIGGAIGGFVSNLIGGAKKLESATLEFSGSVEGVNATIETVVSKQRSFFRGRRFTTTRDDLDTSGINEIIAQVEQVITDTAAMLGVSADALSNFSIDREINVKGKTSEQIEALLEELFSDVILGLIGAFVDGTEGLSERLQKSLETFKGNADEFLQAFQLLATVDLALAIDPVAAVQEAIAAESISMTDAYKGVLASYRELVENYDGSLESLTALTQATLVLKEVQAQLAASLISAGQEISATFQGSAQDIREQMMTEEQLYTLRRSQIDDLVEQAMNTTDPAELQRLAEQINTLGLDAWNLLDEDQKAALGQEFVDFFDGMDEIFGGQIQLGLDTITQDSSAIDQEVADSMTSAAQSIIDANNAARDFWLEQQDWWREQRYRRIGPNEMNP